MSDESKKTLPDGRSASPTPAAAGADLLGEVARGVGQRGPGKRSAEFVLKLANQYGMLPGDLLAATLMDGLRAHLEAGKPASAYLVERARTIGSELGIKRGEALGLLLGVAKELMPYVHQKQPIAIDVDQRSIFFGVVTTDGQAAAPGAGRRDLRPADVRETPMISGPADAWSDAPGRTDAPSALKDKAE